MLNNITFYAFDSDFAAIINRATMKIYQYANYESLINIYDKSNEDVLKVVFLAFNIIVNLHEILLHFNIEYQIYNFGQDKKENYDSLGEKLEIQLFGRIISDLTLKELLFTLNPSNYIQNDFNSFRSKFMKCNEKTLDIDQIFWDYLELFKINPKKLLRAENKRYSFCGLIKKTLNNSGRFTMKRKRPIDYNIDGFQKEDYDYIAQFIERINNLDGKIYENKDSNK